MTTVIRRRKTKSVKIKNIGIGSSFPVSMQSMTKTDTKNVSATVCQINKLQKIGCEIIRVAVKDYESAAAIKDIKKQIKIPIVADIHFDYNLALRAVESGADAIRINPGNIKNSNDLKKILKACKAKAIPIRIGVNSGSAQTKTAQGMVKLALKTIKIFETEKFYDIIISIKSADVLTTIKAYRLIADACPYPLHIGITATGIGLASLTKSAVGIGSLLSSGIGDTVRVSLTSSPEEEIEATKHILQSLGLRFFYPEIISCPTCGRCQVDLVKIVNDFNKKLRTTNYKLHTTPLKVAIMGCEVNGPGEAAQADIGLAFGKNQAVLFEKGKIIKKVRLNNSVKELFRKIKKHCN